MTVDKKEFWQRLAPAVDKVHDATGIPKSVIFAQIATETGWGTSGPWLRGFNPAGLMDPGPPQRPIRFASAAEGIDFYIKTLLHPRYAEVRAATTVEDAVRELGESPWDVTHYANGGGGAGAQLLRLIKDNQLESIDTGAGRGVWERVSAGAASAVTGPFGPIADAAGLAGDAGGRLIDAVTPDIDYRRIVLTAVFVIGGVALVALGVGRAFPGATAAVKSGVKGAAKVAVPL